MVILEENARSSFCVSLKTIDDDAEFHLKAGAGA
jgi:hypothetical protein